ncbi:MAG: FG-GAP-like repeat-containing protein [Gemmataceae bacterium]
MSPKLPPRLTPLDDRLAPAVIGYPDQSFGLYGDGRAYVGPGYYANIDQPLGEAVRAVTPQPDGRLLVLGDPSPYDPFNLPLTRLTAAGQPDYTFGGAAQRSVGFDSPSARPARGIGVAGLADGHILVVAAVDPEGGGPSRVGMLRLTATGAYDPLFGANGRQFFDLPTGYTSTFAGAASAAGPDGRTVVVVPLRPAAGGPTVVGVLRVGAGGAVDPGFGSGGWRVLGLDGPAVPAGVVVTEDGGVVVAATVDRDNGNTDFEVVRLTPTGATDPGFGAGGVATVWFDVPGSSAADTAAGVAVMADGRVVVAGTVAVGPVGGNTDFGVARLTADGRLDPTFGPAGDGRVRYGFDLGGANSDRAAAVAVQPDGRVVVAGTVDTGAALTGVPAATDFRPTGIGVVRLRADGTADPAFALGGSRVELAGSASLNDYGYARYYSFTAGRAAAVLVQPDGRVVVGGASAGGSVSDYYYYPSRYGSAYANGILIGLTGRLGQPAGAAVGGPATGEAVRLTAVGDGTYRLEAPTVPVADTPGPVRTATADFDGDGVEDTAYVAGPGGPPTVRVVSGRTGQDIVAPFRAFEDSFTGGLLAAAADVDGDGRAELTVTPDQGGGPRVRVLQLTGGLPVTRADFFGIDDTNFRGGARAAFGDVNGDGFPDLVVGAGYGGGPRVALFNGRLLFAGLRDDGAPARLAGDFLAFPGADAGQLRDGVFVAAGDLTGDGYAEVIVGGGPGGGPRVIALDGPLLTVGSPDVAVANPVANFFAGGDPAPRGGVRVAARDADGDGQADILAASGEGRPARVWVYRGTSVLGTDAPAVTQELAPFGGAELAGGVYVG